MTKQELMENYTIEQLAEMVMDSKFFDMSEENKKLAKELEKKENIIKQIGSSKTIADFLPAEPIKVADMLINAEVEYEHNQIVKAISGTDKGKYNLFDISELRQIAEHLLVYCNANGEKEE